MQCRVFSFLKNIRGYYLQCSTFLTSNIEDTSEARKKRKNRVTKKANRLKYLEQKAKKCFSVSRILKNELKINDCSHLIAKTKFRIRYFSEETKTRNSVASNFRAAPRNSIPVRIIRIDTLWITSASQMQRKYGEKIKGFG